jgi:Amt family ammonium transporter
MLSLFSKSRLTIRRLAMFSLAFTMVLCFFANTRAYAQTTPPKGDPAGSSTGNAASVIDASGTNFVPPSPSDSDDAATKKSKQDALDAYNKQAKAEPLAVKLADGVGQTQIAANIMWTLITGFLVMFMQAGFAMVEVGFCRAKNAAHVIMTNLMIYPLGALGFWIAGFGIMFGSLAASKIGGPAGLGGLNVLNGPELKIGGFGIASWNTPFLSGNMYDVGVYTMFLFQMVFMDTTATIPTGAMAERWRYSAFLVYGLFISIIGYPIYGHMMWGGGGLAMLGQDHGLGHGAIDFAGSSVVHAVGGLVSLAGVMVLGPRLGKYKKDGTPNTIPAHDIPMAVLGTFILAFGWFGFNPGSTLAAVGGGNLRIAVIATNTMLASAGGSFAALAVIKMKIGKYDAGMAANGMLAGLVAITAPCAFVDSISAVILGAIAGVIVVYSMYFLEAKGIDDPVGAISVHGVCGIWGLISLGIFADGKFGQNWGGVGQTEYLGTKGNDLLGVTGILHGDPKQLVAQCIAAVVCIVWSVGAGWVFFKVQSMVMRIRALPEQEIAGMDISEIGVDAYADFQQHGAALSEE